MRRFWKPFMAAFAMGVFGGCGGTDDVENPAMHVTLQDAADSGTATLQAFARYQNPLLDSIPIWSLTAPVNVSMLLDPATLASSMQHANAAGVPWPSQDTIEFNLQGFNAAHEVFAADFLLLHTGSSYRFSKPNGQAWTLSQQGVLSGALPMTPVVTAFHGQVGTLGTQLGLRSVFIAGSPYKAAVDSATGSFTLPRLAAGRYALKALAYDTLVYTSQDTLNTDSAYTSTNWTQADLIWIPQ